MPLKFYFDTHIAKACAVQLRTRGIEVIRCEEVNMATASDEDHLLYATQHGCIMVSQDEDFTILNAHWQNMGRVHAGIMRVPPEYGSEAQISYVVQELLFYHDAAGWGCRLSN